MKTFVLLLCCLIQSFIFGQESTAGKNVSTFSIASPELKTTKKIWVYLPKGYETSAQKYPVIYMHDAQNLFDSQTSYVGEWNVDETLDSLNAKVIVIGIEHGGEKRIDELTPFKHEKYGGGQANAYLDFIVNTLKPKIDATYHQNQREKHRYDWKLFGWFGKLLRRC